MVVTATANLAATTIARRPMQATHQRSRFRERHFHHHGHLHTRCKIVSSTPVEAAVLINVAHYRQRTPTRGARGGCHRHRRIWIIVFVSVAVFLP